MQKRNTEGVEVLRSSGNVFADLGLPDAEMRIPEQKRHPFRSGPARHSDSNPPLIPIDGRQGFVDVQWHE